MNVKRSEELYEEARRFMPGGVNSPVRAFKAVSGTPLFIQKGENCRITDEDGNTYLDYCCSWGPLILGHSHQYVLEKVTKAIANGLSFGTPNANEILLARRTLNHLHFCDRIRFVNSGTEAVMTAVRLARAFTGRDEIIKFDGCYHGHSDYLLVKAGSGLATFGAASSRGVTANLVKDVHVLSLDDPDSFSRIMDEHGERIAAVIVEPVPANSGLLLQEKTYLELLRAKTREYGSCLIFDEVLSGFRLPDRFAFRHYNIVPDIITLGKVIGGGMPVGAVAGPEKIMGLLAPDGPVYQAGTLSGNPIAMTAGNATLEYLDEQHGFQQLESVWNKFQEKMHSVINALSLPVTFVSTGSLFWFVFDTNTPPRKFAEIPSSSAQKYISFHAELLKHKIYFAPSGYEVGFLSTAHDDDAVDYTVQTIKKILTAIY